MSVFCTQLGIASSGLTSAALAWTVMSLPRMVAPVIVTLAVLSVNPNGSTPKRIPLSSAVRVTSPAANALPDSTWARSRAPDSTVIVCPAKVIAPESPVETPPALVLRVDTVTPVPTWMFAARTVRSLPASPRSPVTFTVSAPASPSASNSAAKSGSRDIRVMVSFPWPPKMTSFCVGLASFTVSNGETTPKIEVVVPKISITPPEPASKSRSVMVSSNPVPV